MTASFVTIRRAAALLLGLLLVLPSAAQAQRPKWWQNEAIQKRLALAPDTIRQIDRLYEGARPELRRQRDRLHDLEQELTAIVDADVRNEVVLAAAVDRVEQARATLNKTRTLMLLRMRRLLSPAQRAALSAVGDQHERPRETRTDTSPSH